MLPMLPMLCPKEPRRSSQGFQCDSDRFGWGLWISLRVGKCKHRRHHNRWQPLKAACPGGGG